MTVSPQTRRLPPAETLLPVAIVTSNLRFNRISPFTDFTVYEPPSAIVNTAIKRPSQACYLSPAYTDNHNPVSPALPLTLMYADLGLANMTSRLSAKERGLVWSKQLQP